MSRELSTIQKRENLNCVYATDEPGIGNASHEYEIRWKLDETYEGFCVIPFQTGPRRSKDSIHGVIDSDLLEIVRDRLKGFQSGEYATRENEMALAHIEEALMWMNKRVEDRIERNVLGALEK